MEQQLYRWVKASERWPKNPMETIFREIANPRNYLSYDFAIRWVDDKIEWLEPVKEINQEAWMDMLIEYHQLQRMEENDTNWNIKILMESYLLIKR